MYGSMIIGEFCRRLSIFVLLVFWILFFFFFFSSRRRHTRWPRDWSSDVCSSDLATGGVATLTVTGTTAGSVTITASGTGSGGALTAGTGNPITFSVIASTTVDHFAFATISSPQTSGIAFNITITAEDAGNNTVTGYS